MINGKLDIKLRQFKHELDTIKKKLKTGKMHASIK